MSARRFLGVAVFLCTFAGLVGLSCLLRTSPTAHPAVVPVERDFVKVAGEGAFRGDVRTTTLHAAHLGGAEPVACPRCHSIDPDGFAKPDRGRCLGCHADRKAALHAAVDDPKPAECTSCHDFLDRTPVEARAWKCGNCHERPHDDALPAGDLADVCGRCHSPHGDAAVAPPSCARCHPAEAQSNRHQGDQVGSKVCFECHRQHDPIENARARCVGCHKDRPKALFANGHTDCTGCHNGHTFSKKTARACTGCHQGQKALASDEVGAHQACLSCHDPHDVKTDASRACARCHAKDPQHATFADGDRCLGCHPAHPGGRDGGAVKVLACTSCHRKATTDRGVHRGAACTDCHGEHAFKKKLEPSFCLGCHSERVGSKRAIDVSQGHGDCTRCHGSDPHDPKKPPACGTCHTDQGTTVPKGHADCKKCHDPHDGELKPDVKQCVTCHADRTKGAHGKIAGGCESCHRPHGPGGHDKPPTCTGCHQRGNLPFLHQESGHATCTDCHDPHQALPHERAVCEKCHTDRANHNPDASSCVGCHPFRKGDK